MNRRITLMTTGMLSIGAASAQVSPAVPIAPSPVSVTAVPANAPTNTASTALPQGTVSDVPAGHWAKDAVDLLVSRGIILGFPDGSFRGTQNLTRYEAALIIARLIQQMPQSQSAIATLSTQDLQIIAGAIRELDNDLQTMGVRVSAVEQNFATRADLAALEERLGALQGSSDSAQLADLQGQIDALQQKVESLDQLTGQVQDNASSIAALNDMSVLLNQDVLDMQDKVQQLEQQSLQFATRDQVSSVQADVTANKAEADRRLAELEQGRVRIGLDGFGVNYSSYALSSGSLPFDVDRVTQGTFAAARHGDGDVTTAELDNREQQPTFGVLGISATNLTRPGSAVSVDEATFGIGVNPWVLVDPAGANANSTGNHVPGLVLSGVRVTGSAYGNRYGVTYSYNGQGVKFNRYFYDNDTTPTRKSDGIANAAVVRYEGQSGLKPEVTAVLGRDNRSGSVLGTTMAARVAVNPSDRFGVGVSYARWADRQGASLDATADFGKVKLDAVYAASVANGQALNERDQAADVQARFGGKGDALQAGGYFQSVSPTWGPQSSGSNDQDYNVLSDITRYGGALHYEFGRPLGLAAGAYYDRLATYNGQLSGDSFGVNLGAKFAGALDLTAFYNSSSSTMSYDQYGNRTLLGHEIDAESTVGGTSPVVGIAAPYARGNNFGVAVTHNGTAGDGNTPLVRGLDLGLGYARMTKVQTNDLSAYARYDGQLGPVEITPFARYRNYMTGDSGYVGFSTLKGGVEVATQQGLLPLGAKLDGGLAMRSTNYTTGQNTSEQLWRVGATLDRPLGENTSFGIGYASYNGRGLTDGRVGVVNNAAFDATRDRIYGGMGGVTAENYRMTGVNTGSSASVNGIYAQLNYRGLMLDYGRFRNRTDGGTTDTSNSFKASYSFKF